MVINKMKPITFFTFFILASVAALLIPGGPSIAGKPDDDATPVQDCSKLPYSTSIELFTQSQTQEACARMTRILEGVRIKDIRTFEKAGVMLEADGCGPSSPKEGVDDLIEIVRRRGQYDKPDSWYGTVDVVYRSCAAFKGAVSTKAIIEMLEAMGPKAKSLSDKDLLTMIIIAKRLHQRGD